MQTSILDQWNRAEHTVLVIENNTDQLNSGGSLYRPVLISNSKRCFSLPSPAFWWNKGIPAPTQPTLFLFRALWPSGSCSLPAREQAASLWLPELQWRCGIAGRRLRKNIFMAELSLMAWAAREVVISLSWGGAKPDGLGEVS